MDSIVSARQAARDLGTSAPRVMRAIDRLGLNVERGPRGRVRLRAAQLKRLRDELGSAPKLPGFSRTEVKLLAALSRSPLGLASVRAVADRAGVSPTAAKNGLRSLSDRGLVRHDRRMIAAGRAREADLFRANVAAPDWPQLAPMLARATPPEGSSRPRPRRVPSRLRHLFWDTAAGQLEIAEHGGYIARRLLTTGDTEGLAWGAAHLSPEHWRHAQRTRGLEADQRALAENLAAS